MEKTEEGDLQEAIAACSKLAQKDDSWEWERAHALEGKTPGTEKGKTTKACKVY